jgi:hypothetical protein
MIQRVPVIGIEPGEQESIKILMSLLRHPDPVVPELTRQALLYLDRVASKTVR